MTKKKIIIFGYSGGLGKSIVKILKNRPYELILYNRKKLNFYSKKAKEQIHQILKKNNADIIINASGVLGDNFDDYKRITPLWAAQHGWELVNYVLGDGAKDPIFDLDLKEQGASEVDTTTVTYGRTINQHRKNTASATTIPIAPIISMGEDGKS